MDKKEVVYCETEEQWIYVNSKLPEDIRLPDDYYVKYGYRYKNLYWVTVGLGGRGWVLDWYKTNGYTIYTFNEWLTKQNLNYKNKISMKELMLEVLNKTYDNIILRDKTAPLFMSNPGIGKTTIIKEFAKSKGVNMIKITLSQRMPNEVVGMVMPDLNNHKLVVYDSFDLESLKDGDILFFDEVFNGTLKQTLDAVLNLLEDRTLPSGKKLADIMIVAASNPQGLINLTPQIKERFIRYDLTFNRDEFEDYLKEKYGIPKLVSQHLSTLIVKEKFDSNSWNYFTPRSIEKAINQIGANLKSPYDDILLPFLSTPIESSCDLPMLNIKKGEIFEYLPILKDTIKKYNEYTKNNKQESRITSNLPN